MTGTYLPRCRAAISRDQAISRSGVAVVSTAPATAKSFPCARNTCTTGAPAATSPRLSGENIRRLSDDPVCAAPTSRISAAAATTVAAQTRCDTMRLGITGPPD